MIGSKPSNEKPVVSRAKFEMDKQIKEFKQFSMDTEIQKALLEWDQYNEKELQNMQLFIEQVTNNKDMLALLIASKTKKDFQFWTDLMENYDFQTYLDIEHYSDKGMVHIVSIMQLVYLSNMEEHHCGCSTVMVKNLKWR